MSIMKPQNQALTMEDLDGFSVKELALVYVGQVKGPDKAMFSYYDTKYYDTKYYDTKYYDTKYYDTKYYEKNNSWGGTYDTDEGGRRYGDSSYNDSGGGPC